MAITDIIIVALWYYYTITAMVTNYRICHLLWRVENSHVNLMTEIQVNCICDALCFLYVTVFVHLNGPLLLPNIIWVEQWDIWGKWIMVYFLSSWEETRDVCSALASVLMVVQFNQVRMTQLWKEPLSSFVECWVQVTGTFWRKGSRFHSFHRLCLNILNISCLCTMILC